MGYANVNHDPLKNVTHYTMKRKSPNLSIFEYNLLSLKKPDHVPAMCTDY